MPNSAARIGSGEDEPADARRGRDRGHDRHRRRDRVRLAAGRVQHRDEHREAAGHQRAADPVTPRQPLREHDRGEDECHRQFEDEDRFHGRQRPRVERRRLQQERDDHRDAAEQPLRMAQQVQQQSGPERLLRLIAIRLAL
jgi:hypothetical protein